MPPVVAPPEASTSPAVSSRVGPPPPRADQLTRDHAGAPRRPLAIAAAFGGRLCRCSQASQVAYSSRDSRANLLTVTDDPTDKENRKDRDKERSDEAHWRVAEEGAEKQSDGPKQQTEKGQEEPPTADT